MAVKVMVVEAVVVVAVVVIIIIAVATFAAPVAAAAIAAAAAAAALVAVVEPQPPRDGNTSDKHIAKDTNSTSRQPCMEFILHAARHEARQNKWLWFRSYGMLVE